MGKHYGLKIHHCCKFHSVLLLLTAALKKSNLQIAKLRKPDASSGLGISLEGTVDVEDGVEVRPHHYIRSILPGGPIGLNGVLRSGDELLEVFLQKLLCIMQN